MSKKSGTSGKAKPVQPRSSPGSAAPQPQKQKGNSFRSLEKTSRKSAAVHSLKVKELYCSILGESSFAGYPCTLIRLAGCNLRCSYCDTDYAWEGGRAMGLDAIASAVEKRGLKLVLVTGGEPMRQAGTPELLSRLIKKGYKLLLETNGTLDLSPVPSGVHIVMDIKTPGSGFHRMNRFENLARLKPTDEIKFVLTSRKDYWWAKKVMEEMELARKFQVIFSPAFGLLAPERLANWMLADRLPARLGLQLHKIIFGPKERKR